jgi:hypothetical protein
MPTKLYSWVILFRWKVQNHILRKQWLFCNGLCEIKRGCMQLSCQRRLYSRGIWFFPFLCLRALLYTSCVLGLRPSALLNEFLLIKKKYSRSICGRYHDYQR